MSRVPFPEDDFVLQIGRAAYAISYIEGGLLGDLARLPGLPPELSIDNLAWRTTGGLGAEIRQHLAGVSDARAQAFLAACAKWLTRLAGPRNDILHARPATIGNAQRPFRWVRKDRGRGPVEAFPIDEAALQSILELVDDAIEEINAVRLPL